MKKPILALFVVACVLGAAGSSLAGSNDKWIVYLKAADSGGSNGLASSYQYGTLTTATDGPPAELINPANDAACGAGSGSAVALACFDLGAGTNNNGFYKDLRAPISSGQKIWNLRLWVQSGWTAGNVVLTGYNPSAYALNGTIPVLLKVVSDPTGSFAAGTTLYTFTGPGTNPQFTKTFTNTNAIKGGAGYVTLQLIAGSGGAATPEPSGLICVLGLVGALSGMAARRRKRS
jgi:hypothetical protein